MYAITVFSALVALASSVAALPDIQKRCDIAYKQQCDDHYKNCMEANGPRAVNTCICSTANFRQEAGFPVSSFSNSSWISLMSCSAVGAWWTALSAFLLDSAFLSSQQQHGWTLTSRNSIIVAKLLL